jgi:hypothetical protein
MSLRLAALCATVTHASARGNLLRLETGGQTACATWSTSATCITSPTDLRVRGTLPRVEPQSSSDPDCNVPPGCERGCPNDAGLPPGLLFYQYCPANHFHTGWDIRAFELVPGGKPEAVAGKNWSRWPAAHWDSADQWPSYPCMSRAAFGSGGLVSVQPGISVATTLFIEQDQSGLYRYELACGNDTTNSDFFAVPLTPWKTPHTQMQLEVGDCKCVHGTRFHAAATSPTAHGRPYP